MTTKVAAVQTFSKLGHPEQNLETVSRLAREAAANGAKLIVFPECMNSGYVWRDSDHALDCADPVPGEFTEGIEKLAAELNVYVAIGISEKGTDEVRNYPVVYNSAVLIGPEGLVGKYQKNFLFDFDPYWFERGHTGYPVFNTEIGKIGMLICADARIPEGARALTLNGAEILLHITNSTTHEQHQHHVPSRGNENEVWMISADKAGREEGLTYPGNSLIIAPDGQVMAQGGEFDEEIIYGDVDLDALRARRGLPAGILAGRRPETYGILAEEYDRLPYSKIAQTPVVPGELSVLAAPLQVANVGGDASVALQRALTVGNEAAKENAGLIVFPELFLCPVGPNEEQAKLAAELTGTALAKFAEIATKWGAAFVLSLVEGESDRLFHTTFVVDSGGEVAGKYRKVHLTENEAGWASAGSEYCVVSLPFGNVGIMSGQEVCLFEVARILTCMGADVIAAPSSWRDEREAGLFLTERALENKVFVVGANRVDAPYPGHSRVVLPNAVVMSKSVLRQDDFTFAYLNLVWARDKQIRPGTDLIRNRRPELYGPICSP